MILATRRQRLLPAGGSPARIRRPTPRGEQVGARSSGPSIIGAADPVGVPEAKLRRQESACARGVG